MPAVKPGSLCPEILIASPVCGLRPVLGALDLTSKVPKPVITTLSPLTRASRMMAKVELTVSKAVFLVRPTFLATLSVSSFLVIV